MRKNHSKTQEKNLLLLLFCNQKTKSNQTTKTKFGPTEKHTCKIFAKNKGEKD